MINDTIAAISSGGKINQAISIIRVSGSESTQIVSKIFSGKIGKNHTITYGNIIDNLNGNKIIDEVLVMWFIGEKTFTGEDTVEINCHGGVVITNRILELLLANGARLATPGEFTRRSFLNGKMDLIKAEAINDLIHAQSMIQTELAVQKFDGRTSKLIEDLKSKLMYLIGKIEVNIDYPEYDDVEKILDNGLLKELSDLNTKISNLVIQSENSRLLFEGIKVAIIGKPNVGKSSLLNCLLGEEKAIVTDEAGTTRDLVEASWQYKGILFKLIDTAGIRHASAKAEQIGIEKSFEQIKNADVVIHVCDTQQQNDEFDTRVIELGKKYNKELITVWNKKDLAKAPKGFISISAQNNDIDSLLETLVSKFKTMSINDADFVTNARQLALIKKAKNNIESAINSLNMGLYSDLVIIDITEAWKNLTDITGRADNEELLDDMFKNFCLGK
ncbi:tRNA uridine-5-carboxymethylaminomethyl(34) synthesis GTPase MnmE [Mycoplasma zalophidermidis]|uniref:tRNA uridine-5-carboxymethylaminomethyl(34) synthesis GTPase MnmE n=1 Tax=Mycoplasma zalophidermidis TaxID=398174 RepID=UPI001C128BA6|nr:tRNA uridine-5-carboxymethylaminomethyl(34) synthesis GTPase MnmE [Mycoplasma zalophidermidis]MBU4689888.1 tRNA uridine-5-carboxymethylaminomethyl(34) synthesis GTPase MnmE [Mycoplasma zalophidermidis]